MDETRNAEIAFIASARRDKVRRLIAALDAFVEIQTGSIDWDAAYQMSLRMQPHEWEWLARTIGVHPPSDETLTMIVDGLRERVKIRNKIRRQQRRGVVYVDRKD